MRTRIAILMAVIATFGAVVAYRAVTAEEDTSTGERRLEQGQIVELNRRAELLNTFRESAQFEDSENLARSRGFFLQQQARELRRTNSPGANALDLQTEEQFAIARMYRRTGNFNYVGLEYKDGLEIGIERKVAEELSGAGAVWAAPLNGELPDIWRDMRRDIDKNRNKTVWLSGLVAIFVLALAFLTFTQLPPDGSPLQRRFERFAYVIAVAASIACFVIDGKSWLPFLVAGIGIGLVAFLGNVLYNRPGVELWLTGAKPVAVPPTEPNAQCRIEGEEQEASHPHEVGPRIPFMGSHLLAWDCTSTMNRFALFLIAVTALLAAICGWRYDCATAYANGSAGRAIDQQVSASKDFGRLQTTNHYMWGLEARMHESRMRFKAAEQRAELARENLFGLTADREQTQMGWQRHLLSEYPSIVQNLDAEWGPEMDPYYPQKESELFGRQESEATFAKLDAENELRQAWHSKAGQYLVTLTLFAIALYLLGQSMGMGLGRGAFILVLGGFLISVGGAFCALKAAVHYLPRDAKKFEPAAECYAKGRQIFLVAHESNDFKEAAKQFEVALTIRPTFALAHYYRGVSLYNSARVHPDEGDSLPSRQSGALAQAVTDVGLSLQEFKKRGVIPPEELVGRYGFFTLLQSLSPPNISLLKQGSAALEEGLKFYPRDPWLEVNLAVALLVSGKTDEAKKAYDKVFADGIWPSLAIAALGDLEIARLYCGASLPAECATISSEIDKLKPRFAIVAGPPPEGARWETRHPSLSNPELSISPAVVSWKASVNAEDGKDVLVVVWYRKDPDWGAWRVISSVSGGVAISSLDSDGADRKSLSLSYLDATGEHRCLDGGEYRAEFYLNGKFVTEQSKSLPLAHEFKGVGLHDINFEACFPSTWSDWAYRSTDVTGPELIRASTSPDRKRGVYLFTYFYPNIPDQSTSIIKQAVLRSDKTMEAHGLPRNLTLERIPEPCGAYPVDFLTKNASWYQDSTRVATARAWIADDGIVYVAMAANAARNGLDADDCILLTSLSNIYGPAVAAQTSTTTSSSNPTTEPADKPAAEPAANSASAPADNASTSSAPR
jgi:hypothetical protein